MNKFAYQSIEEVDPVDGWALLGTAGGVWGKIGHETGGAKFGSETIPTPTSLVVSFQRVCGKEHRHAAYVRILRCYLTLSPAMLQCYNIL